jgi:hypothetical protein
MEVMQQEAEQLVVILRAVLRRHPTPALKALWQNALTFT